MKVHVVGHEDQAWDEDYVYIDSVYLSKGLATKRLTELEKECEYDHWTYAVLKSHELVGLDSIPCAGCRHLVDRHCHAENQWKDFSCRDASV
jgi:hypothetical protein